MAEKVTNHLAYVKHVNKAEPNINSNLFLFRYFDLLSKFFQTNFAFVLKMNHAGSSRTRALA